MVEAPGGEIHLYASASSPLPATITPNQIVAASQLAVGGRATLSPAPMQYPLPMTFVENLSAKFTAPFQLS
jgi:hypothetical protein